MADRWLPRNSWNSAILKLREKKSPCKTTLWVLGINKSKQKKRSHFFFVKKTKPSLLFPPKKKRVSTSVKPFNKAAWLRKVSDGREHLDDELVRGHSGLGGTHPTCLRFASFYGALASVVWWFCLKSAGRNGEKKGGLQFLVQGKPWRQFELLNYRELFIAGWLTWVCFYTISVLDKKAS